VRRKSVLQDESGRADRPRVGHAVGG